MKYAYIQSPNRTCNQETRDATSELVQGSLMFIPIVNKYVRLAVDEVSLSLGGARSLEIYLL